VGQMPHQFHGIKKCLEFRCCTNFKSLVSINIIYFSLFQNSLECSVCSMKEQQNRLSEAIQPRPCVKIRH
jgi:aspartate carbamoyltransferase regulatory subunit